MMEIGRNKRRPAEQLGKRKRQQVQKCGSPGQRLRNPVHEQQILRAGQDEPAGARVGIDHPLQVRQQVGLALHLVEDDRLAREAGQKPARIRRGPRTLVRIFQRHIRVVGKCRAGEKGLRACLKS